MTCLAHPRRQQRTRSQKPGSMARWRPDVFPALPLRVSGGSCRCHSQCSRAPNPLHSPGNSLSRESSGMAEEKVPRLRAKQPHSPSVCPGALDISCLTKTLFFHPEKFILWFHFSPNKRRPAKGTYAESCPRRSTVTRIHTPPQSRLRKPTCTPCPLSPDALRFTF